MKKVHALMAAMAVALPGLAENAPALPEVELENTVAVSNVALRQGAETQDVYIDYQLSGAPAYVLFDILTNGVSIGKAKLRHFSGDATDTDLNKVIEPGTGWKRIVWKARQDWLGNFTTNAQAQVQAYYTNNLWAVKGVYLVVDLSGGPSATSYPVTYTLSAPNVGTDTSCCSNKLWLKRIEPGTFRMGSPSGETGAGNDEILHSVTLTESFFAGVYQVTAAQYALVTGLTPSDTAVAPSVLCPVNKVSFNAVRGSTLGAQWPAAEAVDADSFMGRLQARTGLTFDLPTEAQWEYACRAGTTGAWNNGTTISADTSLIDGNLDLLGWYVNTATDADVTHTHPVGLMAPNAWGLYDMHGNVWEWCLDWYGGYSATAVTNPVGQASGDDRVDRGGAHNRQAKGCRAAQRDHSPTDNGYSPVGFRVFCRLD